MDFEVHRKISTVRQLTLGGQLAQMATPFCARPKNPIFAPDGRRDYSNTEKCSQWPHLYMAYEATCALKFLF